MVRCLIRTESALDWRCWPGFQTWNCLGEISASSPKSAQKGNHQRKLPTCPTLQLGIFISKKSHHMGTDSWNTEMGLLQLQSRLSASSSGSPLTGVLSCVDYIPFRIGHSVNRTLSLNLKPARLVLFLSCFKPRKLFLL